MEQQNRAIENLLASYVNETSLSIKELFVLIPYLHQIYSIGHYHGSKQKAHRVPIEQLKDGEVVATHPSVSIAAAVLGVNQSSVSIAVKKKTKCKGFFLRKVQT